MKGVIKKQAQQQKGYQDSPAPVPHMACQQTHKKVSYKRHNAAQQRQLLLYTHDKAL
jgi:hypothetical protein